MRKKKTKLKKKKTREDDTMGYHGCKPGMIWAHIINVSSLY